MKPPHGPNRDSRAGYHPRIVAYVFMFCDTPNVVVLTFPHGFNVSVRILNDFLQRYWQKVLPGYNLLRPSRFGGYEYNITVSHIESSFYP